MNKSVNSFVIVGGGSAGWITASTLIHKFPNKKITLVESKTVPTIGVGESTIKEINTWLKRLDVDIKDFIVNTEAAYKFGVKFTDFENLGLESFFTHFGEQFQPSDSNGKSNFFYQKEINNDLNFNDYFINYIPQSHMMLNNKFTDLDFPELDPFSTKKYSSFQVNAVKLADYFANKYAIPRGVERIFGNVESINSEYKDIDYLTLDDGSKIYADFFIDCTGFKSLLLGKHLKEPFISTKGILPNNKAFFAPVEYSEKEKELETFTHSIALKNGWAWNTPLWSRIGTGYVYSDEFTDEDSALKEFKNHLDSKNMAHLDTKRSEKININKLEIRNGYYERNWVNNVCAIGLSSAFLDPLEGVGLFFVHDFASKISDLLEKGFYTDLDQKSFNKMFKDEIKENMKFIKTHYILSKRDDSEYWIKIRNNYQENNIISTEILNGNNINSLNTALISLLIGMNFDYKKYDIIDKTLISNTKFIDKMNKAYRSYKINSLKNKQLASKLPTHYEYLSAINKGEHK
jgi:tryptophan halogenase